MKIRTYQTQNKPKEWIFSLISFLQQDQDFERFVLDLRDKLDIPHEGFVVKDWLKDYKVRFLEWKGLETDKKKGQFGVLINGVTKILDLYLLPSWWKFPLQIFVIYGILPLDDSPIEVEPSGKNTIKIRLNEPVSRTEFTKWVQENWQIFKWSFPEVRKSWQPKLKSDMLPIYETIVELKDLQSYTFPEIVDELVNEMQEKFGENYDPEAKINEGSVKRMYQRYKEYLDKLKHKRNTS